MTDEIGDVKCLYRFNKVVFKWKQLIFSNLKFARGNTATIIDDAPNSLVEFAELGEWVGHKKVFIYLI